MKSTLIILTLLIANVCYSQTKCKLEVRSYGEVVFGIKKGAYSKPPLKIDLRQLKQVTIYGIFGEDMLYQFTYRINPQSPIYVQKAEVVADIIGQLEDHSMQMRKALKKYAKEKTTLNDITFELIPCE